MKVGVTLPQFSPDAAAVLDAARRVEAVGLDGVFVFDHLWPMGQPSRPALSAFPLLGALAAHTRSLTVGTLVARIGLLPDDVLLSSLQTVARLAPDRFVAGLGTGDKLSRAENQAYGLDYLSASARRHALGKCLDALARSGIPAWVGCGDGSSAATVALARDHGATVNLWGSSIPPERLVGLARRGPITWGGEVGPNPSDMAGRLSDLSHAGVAWAVCSWPQPPATLEQLVRAAHP
ncbi:MAG: LLM class flavin-dependent oxidoreductase [Acidimicrobiales bacterium]